MPNGYENKPSPENRPERQRRKRNSVWTIIGILIVLALLIWVFAFTYGEQTVSTQEVSTTGSSAVSEAGAPAG